MDASTPTDPPPGVDRAVVLVHGIGGQQRGTVLSGVGGALVSWLGRLRGRGPTAHGVDAAAEEAVEVDVVVERAHDGADGRPAWADVRLTPPGGPPLRIRMVEAFWADVVREPAFLQLIVWAARILPAAVTHHITAIIRTYVGRTRDGLRSGRPLERGIGAVRAVAFLPLLGLLVLLTGLLTPLVLAALLLTLVLGAVGTALPVAASIASWLQTLLTGSLGDTSYLLSNDVQRAYVAGRVADAIDLATQAVGGQATDVIVVAHSQGAAAAYYALEHRPAGQAVSLVTVGQGLAKIERLRVRATSVLMALPSIAMPIVIVLAYAEVRSGRIGALDDAVRAVLAAALPPLLVLALAWALLAVLGAVSPRIRHQVQTALCLLVGLDPPDPPDVDPTAVRGAGAAADRAGPRRKATQAPIAPDRGPPDLAPTAPPRHDPSAVFGIQTSRPVWQDLLAGLRPDALRVVGIGATAAVGAIGVWAEDVMAIPTAFPGPVLVLVNVLLLATITSIALLWTQWGRVPVAWPSGARSWLDLWASADPVPNGRLATPAGAAGRFDSAEVVNHGSAVLDHTTYFRNTTSVLPAIADALLPDGWTLRTPTGGDLLDDGRERCRRLGSWAWIAHAAAVLVAAVALVVGPPVLLAGRIPIGWASLPTWIPMSGQVDRLAAAALLSALVWATVWLGARAWIRRGWSARLVVDRTIALDDTSTHAVPEATAPTVAPSPPTPGVPGPAEGPARAS